jgi:hypothetical protein
MDNSLRALQHELGKWSGVEQQLDLTHRHPRLYLRFAGRTRFIHFSKTRVDPRGMLNKVHEMRRTLRSLGAERNL